jgi:hypothetical protein
MTTTRRSELQREEEKVAAERLAVPIRQQVLQALGTPPGWHMVQVRSLWGDYFRVNVLVGESITSFSIRHSFFLLTDGEGSVLEASPEMVKRY